MAESVRCAIWARVSTTDQCTANQLEVLRDWAARRGLEIVTEFATEDSAWSSGNGKGAEFDAARKKLLAGAHHGDYSVVLIWALDRLGRRGTEDTLATLRQLYERGADVWSYTEDWLVTSTPAMRELLVSIFAWMAQQESNRRSERIRAGLARRKAAGLPVGGRQQGSRDRKPRARAGYQARWDRQRESKSS